MLTRVLKDTYAVSHDNSQDGYIVQTCHPNMCFTTWKDYSTHDDEQSAIEKAESLGTYVGLYEF